MTALRILVYPHDLGIGGSQLNAIELGRAVKDLGHQVILTGENGALVSVAEELALDFLPMPAGRRRPSLATILQLRRLIDSHKIDIIHGYEWPPGLESAVTALLARRRAAAVCTVMSMAVAPFLPETLPLVVGTRSLQRITAPKRKGPVYLIEPPIDTERNLPDLDIEPFLRHFGLDNDEPGKPIGETITVGIVCRLVPALKLEGALTAIDVIGRLAKHRPVRLVVVGDGVARDAVEQRANEANAYAGWRSVVLTGALLDPRPAYAASNIMLGMGGSALRSLAFGKPLVVQGEKGFWELLTPDSCPRFLDMGWYGVGCDNNGRERLTEALLPLLDSSALRRRLGKYGRDLVVQRFSLRRAARIQEEIYQSALERKIPRFSRGQAAALAQSALRLGAYKLRVRYERMCGSSACEDFNTVALAQAALGGDKYPKSTDQS